MSIRLRSVLSFQTFVEVEFHWYCLDTLHKPSSHMHHLTFDGPCCSTVQPPHSKSREGTNETLLLVAGWPELHDAWTSTDGSEWTLVSNSSWNCTASACGKYDFWAVVDVQPGLGNRVVTFGGSNAYSTFGKLWADTWSYG